MAEIYKKKDEKEEFKFFLQEKENKGLLEKLAIKEKEIEELKKVIKDAIEKIGRLF